MKSKWTRIVFLFIVLGIIGIVSFNKLTKRKADWNFIQKVGGIKTLTPIDTEDGYYLPVVCNVSGCDSITTKPIVLNSALICNNVDVNLSDNKIYLTVILGIAKVNGRDCNCKAVNIGKLKPGSYSIYYNDEPNQPLIGQFMIK